MAFLHRSRLPKVEILQAASDLPLEIPVLALVNGLAHSLPFKPSMSEELRGRTRQFALDVVAFCIKLPHGDLTRVVRPQLLRAGTGVGSNHRAACRSRSAKEFAARIGVVVEEADESDFWLDVLEVNRYGLAEHVSCLRSEAAEIRAIMAKSRTTTLKNLKRRKRERRARNKEMTQVPTD